MATIDHQQLYNEIQEKKEQKKTIRASIKDHYDTSPTWKKIKEELDEIKAKKKTYDNEVKQAFGKDFDEMMRLSQEIKAEEELLSDLCFQDLLQNKQVEIKDAKGNTFEPVIKVAFKKR